MIEPSEGRNDVEVLAEEYLTRRRNGEHPSIAEYVTSYPELADEIHEVFPAVDLMEKLRPGSMDLTSGHAGSMSKTVKLKSIGDYRILREIGRGGMGVVYEAQQRSLGRRVALKVLPRHASDSAAALERFRREARVAAQLHHTNIVPVFEVGEEDDTCYYAMQFIQGQSLDSVQQELVRLRDRNADRRTDSVDARSGAAEIHTTQMAQDDTNSVTLPGPLKLSSASTNLSHYFRSVAKLGYRVAQALGHAHSRGIVHRDVKPSNLLLDGQGDVWVADFGLAKTGGDAITRTGDLLGTVRYMSPERFNGQCDERADIYGLGMSLYELLTLKPAYAGKNHAQLVESICHREPSHPRAIDPHIPLDLETIVLKAIDKDPRRRYQSAADLAEDLKRFIDDEPVKARRISSVERLSRWARRNKSVAASLATVATLLVLWVVAATVAAAHFSQQEQEQRALKEKESNAKAEAQELAEDRRSRLVRLNVARAAQAMEQDDLLGSLPWFVEALRLDSDDPSREQLHRTRLAAVWARCPRLIHLWSYPYRPDQVEYSKDGRHLLIACPDRVVVRDSISGDEVFELRHHWAEPVAALSPDGRTLLVADTPKTVTLFDIPSGERKGPAIELNSNVTCAAFSPDNRLFAVGDNQGLTRVFDPKSLKAIGEPIAHQARVQQVAFSPNSRFVLTGSRDKTARIWVARTGEPWGPPLEHDDAIQYVGFRPDGERVVTTSHDRTARLWGITSGKQYAVFKHRSLIVEANFSPDSKRLVTASFDQTAQIWDADSGKAITPPLEHKHVVQSARFSPDGKRVVTAAEDQTARVWDSTTGKQVAPPLRHANVLLSAEFHPDGKHVATASQNGIVRQWLLTGSDQMSPPQRHGSYVFDVDVSADGWVMATASSDKTARIWNVETGEPVSPPLVHDANVTRVQFSPDGSRVVTAALDFTIRIWDARTGRPLTPPLGPTGWSEFPRNVHHDRAFAAFSPDGRFVAGGFSSLTKRTGVVRVWDAETGKPSCPSMVHNERINDIVFGPQGERLATAGVDKKAFLWRVADGERMLDIDHAAPVNSVRFSTDGKRLATATGYRTVGEARVWDAETGQPTSLAMKHQGSVRVAAFSPDGTRIATCSNDHTARIWDAETGRPISAPIPHGDQVRHVEFSPDGQCIVTCAWGMYYDDVPKRGVRVWDASTGQPIAPLPLHHRNTFVARFTSDSLGVAIASTREQTGKLWNLRPDQRPLQDWIDISQLVSGQGIDSSDALTPADVPDLVAAYRSLRTKYPSDFHREPDQQLASVREAAQRCVQARQWSAAKSYIDTLRTAGSDDEGLRRMANEVAWALLNEPVSGGAEDAELLELAQFAIPKTRHGAKGAIQWSVLKPLAMRSTNGAALVLQEDESILVAGENPKADSYIVLCDTHLRGITGLKLETLPHHTLPGNGPGRHPSGRFMLSEITLRAARLSSSDAPVRIPLKSASATFNQTSGMSRLPLTEAMSQVGALGRDKGDRNTPFTRRMLQSITTVVPD